MLISCFHSRRRVLPSSALSRIFFPSQKELEEYFTPSCLPKGTFRPARRDLKPLYNLTAEYGGHLPPLQDLDDPLRLNHTLPNGLGDATPENPPILTSSRPPIRLSPTSIQNPFFGYPTLF